MKTDKNTDNQNTKRRSTFAILFYINRTKVRKDGMCQLLCKVSIDAEWEQIGTKVSVNPAIWNPEKGRADGRSENAVTVNRAIDELTKEITGHYNHIKKSLGFVTAELVKNAVKGIGQKPVTLLALFREHNEEFKKRVGVWIESRRPTTVTNAHTSTLQRLFRRNGVWKMSLYEV